MTKAMHEGRRPHEKATYIGTVHDLKVVLGGPFCTYYDMSSPEVWHLWGICLVDLPFSFVADTLLLPYAIPADLEYARKKKERKAAERESAEKTSSQKENK